MSVSEYDEYLEIAKEILKAKNIQSLKNIEAIGQMITVQKIGINGFKSKNKRTAPIKHIIPKMVSNNSSDVSLFLSIF